MMGSAEAQLQKTGPVRTCAGCREQDAQTALLRFALRPEARGVAPSLVPDPKRRLGGRGVSVHPRRRCLSQAVRRGGFARALRTHVEVDLDELCSLIRARYAERINGLLLAARRTDRISLGTDAVRAALHDGSAKVVLFAGDAAGRREELVSLAKRTEVPVVHHGTKTQLGRLTGRTELGVLAIHDRRIASELVAVSARAQDLSEAE